MPPVALPVALDAEKFLLPLDWAKVELAAGAAPDEGNGGNWDEALRASDDVSSLSVFALRHQSQRGKPPLLWQPVIDNMANATIDACIRWYRMAILPRRERALW